jgi:hypothetical protein
LDTINNTEGEYIMEIRSPLLDSNLTRNNLSPGKDQMGTFYDALQKVNAAVNPHETPEARAMRYEDQFNKTMKRAREVAVEAGETLHSLEQAIKAQALGQSGLNAPPASGAEIRASLRGMTQAKRDQAIHDAFDRNDRELLASIYGQNRVTWGGTSKPLEKQFSLYIETNAPDAAENGEALDKVSEALDLAINTFSSSATEWRDPASAARGFAQQEQYDKADAALKAALGD